MGEKQSPGTIPTRPSSLALVSPAVRNVHMLRVNSLVHFPLIVNIACLGTPEVRGEVSSSRRAQAAPSVSS